MAGDWIKMRTNLEADPRIEELCLLLPTVHRCHIIGALHHLWSYADEHSTVIGPEDDCVAAIRFFRAAQLDLAVGIEGFARALERVDWLEVSENALTIPRWGDHNSGTAKARAMGARRQKLRRAGMAGPVTQHRDKTSRKAVTQPAAPKPSVTPDRDVDRDQTTRDETTRDEKGGCAPWAPVPTPPPIDIIQQTAEVFDDMRADGVPDHPLVEPHATTRYPAHFTPGSVPAEIDTALVYFFGPPPKAPSSRARTRARDFAGEDEYGVELVAQTIRRLKDQKKPFKQLGPELAASTFKDADKGEVPRGTTGVDAVKRVIAKRKKREGK